MVASSGRVGIIQLYFYHSYTIRKIHRPPCGLQSAPWPRKCPTLPLVHVPTPHETNTASPAESELISRKHGGLPYETLGMDPTLALLLGLPVPLLYRFWKADDMLPFVMLEQLQRRAPVRPPPENISR